MTSHDNDIILKSWLRTLRYTIEYYEDTFDLKNNRQSREVSHRESVKNMNIGGETKEESDDEHYVNIWECRDSKKSEKSASKLQNSLESVGNNSEVSIFEEDNSSLNLTAYSTTDSSVGSYVLADTQSSNSCLEITDLDQGIVNRRPKKPKVTPRKSKEPKRNEVVYENLPLRSQNLSFSHINDEQMNHAQKHNDDISEDAPIYENLPLRPQILPHCSVDIQEETQNSTQNSPIYENLPLFPKNCVQSCSSLSDDDSNFEEAVSSTIQYLENVLDAVDTFSDDSESEVCETSLKSNSLNTFESDYSSINLTIEEDTHNIDEEKYTESSSSFEEYVSNEDLKRSNYGDIELEPQHLSQRFAKNSRVSAFWEELEPGLPQEVKDIPIPKRKIGGFDPQNRFSIPNYLREFRNRLDAVRPQSLRSTGPDNVDVEEFESFAQYLKGELLNSTKESEDIDGFKPHKSSEPNNDNVLNDSDELLIKKSIPSLTISTQIPLSCEKDQSSSNSDVGDSTNIEDSKIENLTVSFAEESRVSTSFEEETVEELEIFEVAPEKIVFEKDTILDNLREDLLVWMADIMEDYCGENLDIMEEKELLKSINQYPRERIERSPENKFPLDDENVEVRRKPSIQRNRISKTTDFDLGRRRQDRPVNPKNFDIRGIVKFQLPNNNTVITKLNQEYIAYENENFYRINEKTKAKVLLQQNILLKSARYLKSKECKEVELRDGQNLPYMLYFDSIKYAKLFMENEKIQVYVTDNKVTIKKTLLRFLGKRSSREILEKKGIYKNEPIFGNTLRDIYMKGTTNSGSPVPMFIYKVIELIERPENIKSLGLYRTSGNLATIQKIRFEVDNGRLEILDQFSKDPDVLTGSLKLFFRELKEPLIPCEVCEKLMEITKLDLHKMSPKDHQKIKSTLVKNLHEANLETFYVVIRHLLEVAKYKEHNKMDTYNLAVCWGPSMIFSAHQESLTIEMSKDIVTQSHGAARLIDFLLGYYELYEAELNGLSKRPDSLTEKLLFLKRQESRDSVKSSDSSKSQKKSSSNLSLSIDEITKKLVDLIEPNLSTEGLYKTPGSPEKTNKLMKKLNKKKINELDKNKTDVYEMADTLKRYLREQDGLVNKETIELVLKAASDNSQNYLEPVTRRKVAALIEETPKKDTLIFILRHLAKVIDHESRHKVSKKDILAIWTDVLDYQRKCQVSYEEFNKFLTVAVEVFNDNLPDIVRSSFGNNNGGSPNRNDIMGQVVKQMKHQQEKERDRNSRYDNVDVDVAGEASILDAKTEQTKL